MLTFFCIERPETANLRPCRWAIWMACCTRWMCEAKQATMTRPSASAKIWWNAWPTIALGGGRARGLGVGGVGQQRQHALLAELGERVDVGDAPVDRRVVELVVAGEDDGAEVGPEHDRQGVGDAVAHGHERELERPEAEA